MKTRKKEKNGNAFGDKRGVIAGGVAPGGVFVLEVGVRFGLIQNGLKGAAGAEAADVNLVVFDAADHIHVEHGDGFVEWQRGIPDPRCRAKETKLFASKVRKKNAALELAFKRSEESGEFQNSC